MILFLNTWMVTKTHKNNIFEVLKHMFETIILRQIGGKLRNGCHMKKMPFWEGRVSYAGEPGQFGTHPYIYIWRIYKLLLVLAEHRM